MTTEPSGAAERRVAEFATSFRWEDLPASLVHEAKRSILNILASGFAGSREPAIDQYLSVITPFAGQPRAGLIGRSERIDVPTAAFLNAAAANIHDFDDTHPATIIHPTAPVAPALFALAEDRQVPGAVFLRAFILGAEVECRIGNAISPWHYARGWHITSTCGVFGSSVATGALIGLDSAQMEWAIANAAAQSAGLVETLGTMSKSLSMGNAARNGILAALLAQRGFSGPPAVMTGEHGYLRVHADTPDVDALIRGLGSDWEFATNTYKPWPVGVVLNPVVDACMQLHAEGFDPVEIVSVTARGHPLLRERTDRPLVTTGREAQISAQHTMAIVLRRGRAGLAEYSDGATAETFGVRPVVTFVDEPERDIASALFEFALRDGSRRTVEIETAKGSAANPMTDSDLERKLTALASGAGQTDVARLIDAVWTLDRQDDAGIVPRLAASPP